MIGFFIVNREVLVARALEQSGRYAPGLDFIRWRYEQLKIELWDDAEFWGIPHKDIALSRAAEIAEARGSQTTLQTLHREIPVDSRTSEPIHPGDAETWQL